MPDYGLGLDMLTTEDVSILSIEPFIEAQI